MWPSRAEASGARRTTERPSELTTRTSSVAVAHPSSMQPPATRTRPSGSVDAVCAARPPTHWRVGPRAGRTASGGGLELGRLAGAARRCCMGAPAGAAPPHATACAGPDPWTAGGGPTRTGGPGTLVARHPHRGGSGSWGGGCPGRRCGASLASASGGAGSPPSPSSPWPGSAPPCRWRSGRPAGTRRPPTSASSTPREPSDTGLVVCPPGLELETDAGPGPCFEHTVTSEIDVIRADPQVRGAARFAYRTLDIGPSRDPADLTSFSVGSHLARRSQRRSRPWRATRSSWPAGSPARARPTRRWSRSRRWSALGVDAGDRVWVRFSGSDGELVPVTITGVRPHARPSCSRSARPARARRS